MLTPDARRTGDSPSSGQGKQRRVAVSINQPRPQTCSIARQNSTPTSIDSNIQPPPRSITSCWDMYPPFMKRMSRGFASSAAARSVI